MSSLTFPAPLQQQLSEADSQFRNGYFDSADELYSNLLVAIENLKDCEDADICSMALKVAESRYASGSYEKAKLAYEKLLTLLENKPDLSNKDRIFAYVKAARNYEKCDDQTNAQTRYEQAYDLAKSVLPVRHFLRKTVLECYAQWLRTQKSNPLVLSILESELEASSPATKDVDSSTAAAEREATSAESTSREKTSSEKRDSRKSEDDFAGMRSKLGQRKQPVKPVPESDSNSSSSEKNTSAQPKSKPDQSLDRQVASRKFLPHSFGTKKDKIDKSKLKSALVDGFTESNERSSEGSTSTQSAAAAAAAADSMAANSATADLMATESAAVNSTSVSETGKAVHTTTAAEVSNDRHEFDLSAVYESEEFRDPVSDAELEIDLEMERLLAESARLLFNIESLNSFEQSKTEQKSASQHTTREAETDTKIELKTKAEEETKTEKEEKRKQEQEQEEEEAEAVDEQANSGLALKGASVVAMRRSERSFFGQEEEKKEKSALFNLGDFIEKFLPSTSTLGKVVRIGVPLGLVICGVGFAITSNSNSKPEKLANAPKFMAPLMNKNFGTSDGALSLLFKPNNLEIRFGKIKREPKVYFWQGTTNDEMRLLQGTFKNCVWIRPSQEGLTTGDGEILYSANAPERKVRELIDTLKTNALGYFAASGLYPNPEAVQPDKYVNPVTQKYDPVNTCSMIFGKDRPKDADTRLELDLENGQMFNDEPAPKPGAVSVFCLQTANPNQQPGEPDQLSTKSMYIHGFDRTGAMLRTGPSKKILLVELKPTGQKILSSDDYSKQYKSCDVCFSQAEPPSQQAVAFKYALITLLAIGGVGVFLGLLNAAPKQETET